MQKTQLNQLRNILVKRYSTHFTLDLLLRVLYSITIEREELIMTFMMIGLLFIGAIIYGAGVLIHWLEEEGY